MPLYDFRCTKCEHIFEGTIPRGAPPPPCPACWNKRTERLLSPPPVIFKGTGFYKTDSTAKPAAKNEPKPAETDVQGAKKDTSAPKKPAAGETGEASGKAEKHLA